MVSGEHFHNSQFEPGHSDARDQFIQEMAGHSLSTVGASSAVYEKDDGRCYASTSTKVPHL